MTVAEMRKAVLAAMKQCDDLTEPLFLKKYHRKASKRYLVRHPARSGMCYPSKAIAIAAFGGNFTGGISKPNGAAWKLAKAGFEITDLHGNTIDVLKIGDANKRISDAFSKQVENLDPKRKRQIVESRIGQDILRQELLRIRDDMCEVTRLDHPSLLRASHIKPWRDCDGKAEKLDIENVLLLSANWDLAFDRGLVTFDQAGAPQFSRGLSMATQKSFRDNVHRSIEISPKKNLYLEWHRTQIFKQ